MANPIRTAHKDDILDVGGIQIPVAMLATLAPVETTKTGMQIINESPKIRVPELRDADGMPIMFSLVIRVERSPSTVEEMERHARVRQDKIDAQTLRLQNEQDKRDREVKYAREATRSDILATQRDMEQRQNTASKLRESLELAAVVASMLPKTLPPASE